MYVTRRRGVGQADLSSWGFVSPCAAASTPAASTTAPAGQPCAPASTFPFFGTSDGASCQPASPTLGLAAMGVGLLLLYGVFDHGGRG